MDAEKSKEEVDSTDPLDFERSEWIDFKAGEIADRYENVSEDVAVAFMLEIEEDVKSAANEAIDRIIRERAHARGWFEKEGVDIDEIDIDVE